MNGQVDEGKSPCVLQEFVPFGAAAKKRDASCVFGVEGHVKGAPPTHPQQYCNPALLVFLFLSFFVTVFFSFFFFLSFSLPFSYFFSFPTTSFDGSLKVPSPMPQLRHTQKYLDGQTDRRTTQRVALQKQKKRKYYLEHKYINKIGNCSFINSGFTKKSVE